MTKPAETRITKRFSALAEKGEKALIAFITAGDPDMDTTEEIVYEIERAGADILELGIPFSDPMADGPTIQASSERALKGGATLSGVLKLVRKIRLKSELPIVLFGYYNPIFVYGPERFARDAAAAGADGVLVVDLPPEESGELTCELTAGGLDHIFTLTPTSDDERMKLVSATSSGFIYYVSVTGVTGARAKVATRVKDSVNKVRSFSPLPVCVGFGVSTPEQVRALTKCSDGVIVGSAIVNLIKENAGSGDLPSRVGKFIANLKRATVR